MMEVKTKFQLKYSAIVEANRLESLADDKNFHSKTDIKPTLIIISLIKTQPTIELWKQALYLFS